MIFSSVNKIIQDTSAPAEYPLGVFTSLERDKWADLRKYLIKLGNQESLNVIDGSLFVLALDDATSENPSDIVKLFLHADGTNR